MRGSDFPSRAGNEPQDHRTAKQDLCPVAISAGQGRLRARSSELVKICQILRPAGSHFGRDQVRLSKATNWKIRFLRNDPVLPSFLKITAKDRGEEIDLARWNAEIELSSGIRKVSQGLAQAIHPNLSCSGAGNGESPHSHPPPDIEHHARVSFVTDL